MDTGSPGTEDPQRLITKTGEVAGHASDLPFNRHTILWPFKLIFRQSIQWAEKALRWSLAPPLKLETGLA